ncbi:hypothetical protein TARUN_1747 [Trichoderma arundinaceum]|uniref:Nephrocystin 3-like N-terminal domain-containing protein n=1 Tax=Trichoderma arundinaceum TaxID=490622 RepID=A0A395NWN2_TRIAR|nr:hypothetical protein TARUN_1747 [Trichoderma arundinaceum]
MAPSTIPSIHLQPPSVDFIDNRLPNIHDVFRHRDVHYDPDLQKYVQNQTLTDGPHASRSRDNSQALVQPEYTFGDIEESEKFWGLIFADAMNKFTREYPKEPKQRDESGFSIRKQTTWKGVNEQLHKAREVYDGTKQGFRGRLTVDLNDRNLEDLFGDVEVFLITFPDMDKIKDAATTLVVSVMKAIEDAIGFFLSHQASRAVSALGRGKSGYQKPLLESLVAIQASSQKLIHQAQNAHFVSTQIGLKAIWDDTGRLVMSQHQTGQAIEYLIDKVDRVYREGAQFYNTVNRLLMDAEENKKARYLSLQNKIASLEEKIASLEGSSRASTPATPELSPMWPNQYSSWAGHQSPAWPSLSYYHMWPTFFPPQEAAMRPLNENSYLPPDLLSVQNPLLPPRLQSRSISSSSLLDLLGIQSDLDKTDLNTVKEYRYRIPRKFRARAEQVTQTLQFRNWVVTPNSCRLLIHGELPQQGLTIGHISPLSHFCAMLVQMLRARDKYISSIFFCGSHVEQEDGNIGGIAMMKSLLVQLLQQLPFESIPLDGTVDWNCLEKNEWSISQICDLFVHLIRSRLHRDYTFACIIDGIGHYETDELEPDVLFAMKALFQLSKETRQDSKVGETSYGDVKILVTTPFSTDAVQRLFFDDESGDDEMSFLSMSGLLEANERANMRMPGYFLSDGDLGDGDLDSSSAIASLIDSDNEDSL